MKMIASLASVAGLLASSFLLPGKQPRRSSPRLRNSIPSPPEIPA
jgi:hypothetical protein